MTTRTRPAQERASFLHSTIALAAILETRQMDNTSLENWLWEAACEIRGPLDAPKFKDYILPLIFLKRLSDVFDDEVEHLGAEFGDRDTAARLVEQDHKLVRFHIPPQSRWSKIATTTTGLGQFLTDAVRAVARENPRLSGVIDITDFNATTAGQRIVDCTLAPAGAFLLADCGKALARRQRATWDGTAPAVSGEVITTLVLTL